MARPYLSPQGLRGKVIAVTGGARGIGRATAAAFLAAGADVAIGDIDAGLAAETGAELSARSGARIVGLPLDVTDADSFANFLAAAEAELGPLDVLVNNAGIMPTGLFSDEDPAMTARMVDINVNGVLIGSRLAVQRFRPRGGGHIVNIASLAGVTVLPGLATYCGTKRFVIGFTETLERELRTDGVAVTLVLPGVVRTELSAGTRIPKWMEGITTVDPENVADGIVAAVAKRKRRAVSPKSLGQLLASMAILPSGARYALLHALKIDVGATHVDPVLRERYHRRLNGGAA
ncbi:SDR family oxidoreductase [Nocardia sp. NPDC005998]|uniref:SDR family oxidoreductase n=1 Tax=Nocardia sp. NPDC005998 TaxID=3156894 RepID=UPI0033A32DC9